MADLVDIFRLEKHSQFRSNRRYAFRDTRMDNILDSIEEKKNKYLNDKKHKQSTEREQT